MISKANTKRTPQERIAHAEAMCGMWLNRANEAAEGGLDAVAENCYGKSQVWLDKLNRLEGNF